MITLAELHQEIRLMRYEYDKKNLRHPADIEYFARQRIRARRLLADDEGSVLNGGINIIDN